MLRRTTTLAIALALAALLAASLLGCASQTPEQGSEGTTPSAPAQTPSGTPEGGGPAAGMQLAPGLYEQQDGDYLAIGVLEYRDLEGGFWALIDTRQGAETEGDVIAVVANAEKNDAAYTALAGQQVVVTGKKLDGASIRQAGPEIEARKIEPYATGGPAD